MKRISTRKGKTERALVEASPEMPDAQFRARRFAIYREDVVDEICARLASGESLRKICGKGDLNKEMSNPNMPHFDTVMHWLDKYEEFRRRYARAREIQSEVLMDELVEIADDAANDMVEITRWGKTKLVLNREHVERARLRVDARKWAITKLYARKYGERTLVEHSGAVGSFDLTKMATDDLEQLERILAGATPSEGDQP